MSEILAATMEPIAPVAVVETPKAKARGLPAVEVITEPLGGDKVQIVLKCRRVFGPILEQSRVSARKMAEERLFEPAKELPEVNALGTLQGKRNVMNAEMARIQLDMQQLDLNRKRAVADLTGTELATKLAEIDGERRRLGDLLKACETGRELFGKEVEDATALARKAIETHIRAVSNSLLDENKAALAKAISNIEASVPLLELLDKAIVIDRVGSLTRSNVSNYGPRVEELLRAAVVGA